MSDLVIYKIKEYKECHYQDQPSLNNLNDIIKFLYPLILLITRSDIRPHIEWAVNLVTVNGHFDFPWVYVSMHGLRNLGSPVGGLGGSIGSYLVYLLDMHIK